MKRNRLALVILAAGAVMSAPLAAYAQSQGTDLASVSTSGSFEFRGRNTMWKFTADGRVAADDSAIARLSQGGSSEIWGMKNEGTWRRAGNELCIKWQDARGGAEDCYTVTPGNGRMVKLVGKKTIEGTLNASTPPAGYATTPSTPQSAQQPYYYKPYQRIPGAR